MPSIFRHDAYKTGYFTLERQLVSGADATLVKFKVPIELSAVPEAYQAFGTFKDRHGIDPNVDVIASGTVYAINDLVGVVMNDVKDGDEAMILVGCPGDQGIYLLADPAATSILKGEKVYVIDPAEATIGGMVTNSAMGGPGQPTTIATNWIFVDDWANRVIDPTDQPAGKYVRVFMR